MTRKELKKLNKKARRTNNSRVEKDPNDPAIVWLRKGDPGFSKARYTEVYVNMPPTEKSAVILYDAVRNDILNQVRPV